MKNRGFCGMFIKNFLKMILYKIRLANTRKSMQKILGIIGIVMNSIIANGCKKYQEPENEICTTDI